MHVAVLGAGIMGVSTALFLARRGMRVTLFDRAPRPFTGASRWNEGKIHLGYLYAADPSLATARRILPGGLAFKPLVEELVGCSIDPAITPDIDTFLIHRDSVVDADAAERYYRAVAALIDSHERTDRYLARIDTGRPRRLTTSELDAHYDAARFRTFNHRERHPILVRAGRVVELELDEHVGCARRHDPAEPDKGPVADGLQDGCEWLSSPAVSSFVSARPCAINRPTASPRRPCVRRAT